MTQEERRICLIRALEKEMPQYGDIPLPKDEEEQKGLLRSLMNVRPPIPAQPDFLAVQDDYLTEVVRERGIVDPGGLPPVSPGKRLYLWKGDITRLKADAIVNAANSALLGCFIPQHFCIDNMIHSFSGVQLRLACNEIMQAQGHEEPTGSAKITPGYNLPCKYILHTVGPVISECLSEHDCDLLAGCYQSCLELAVKNQVRSIGFCCISTGVFRFPQDKAAEIAVRTVSHFLEQDQTLQQVIFNVYTDKDRMIYEDLLLALAAQGHKQI